VGFYDMLYGTAGVDLQTLTLTWFGNANGLVFSGNPPYSVTDFASIYPKFLGPQTAVTGTATTSSSEFTGISTNLIPSLAIGQLISSSAFPKDTLITAVGSSSITLSNPASVSATSIVVYTAPFVPILVILNYIFLASVSILQARYHGMWYQCMSWFIAHYCTLYMRTESGPNETASEVAASGLTKGMLVHRAAGDVSATSQIVQGYEQWGAWQETEYGVQLMTVARGIACGPIFVQ
jgi:hypothetical protein